MADQDLPLLRACLAESRALRSHRRPRRSPVSGLLLAAGALVLAVTVPATVQGLQPVPVADAAVRPAAQQLTRTTVPVEPDPKPVRVAAAKAVAPVAAVRAVGVPVHVSVPSVRIDAPVVRLGLRRDASMYVPKRPGTVGWFKRGPRPGEPGPALLVGHVDSTEGPAAFFGLRRAEPGDLVYVRDDAGRTSTFVVDQVSRFRKKAFPTRLVFGGVRGPELRMVTCAGSFNRLTRSYSHNIVVYARLATGAGA